MVEFGGGRDTFSREADGAGAGSAAQRRERAGRDAAGDAGAVAGDGGGWEQAAGGGAGVGGGGERSGAAGGGVSAVWRGEGGGAGGGWDVALGIFAACLSAAGGSLFSAVAFAAAVA